MAVAHASVSVAQVAIALIDLVADTDKIAGDANSVTRRVVISNEGANIVFIGGSGVTNAAYGAKLAATTGQITLELGVDDALYAIATTGTNVVRVLHIGV